MSHLDGEARRTDDGSDLQSGLLDEMSPGTEHRDSKVSMGFNTESMRGGTFGRRS